MDPLPVIFDISSDDETCCDEPRGDDYDWLSEILTSVDEPLDDSDDVVVLSEVNPRKRAKLSKPVEKDSDDECVVLDGDPDKPMGLAEEPETESDELLIVGEKGQVACRDFPHSRQHCAKFPFNSTPHERHCNMCHCYVCDSVAPCIYWSNGTSDVDHCHATEKEEIWKLQRSLKQRISAPPLVMKLPNTPDSLSLTQLSQVSQINQIRRFNQVSHCNNVQPSTIIRSTSNPIIQNQVSRPTPIRARTSSANIVQGTMSQVRGNLSRQIVTENRAQRRMVSQQLVGLSNDVVQKEKDNYIGNLGTQFVPSHKTLQMSIGGALPMNQSEYGSPYSISHAHAVQQPRSLLSMEALNDTSDLLGMSTGMNLESGTNQNSSQSNIGNIHLNTMPSQPQAQSQLMSQSNDCRNVYQHVNQSQNATDPSFSNPQNHAKVQPPVESFQLNCAVPEYETLLVKESSSLFPVSNDPSLPDFEFESWLLENDPFSGIADDSGPPIDAGMLYFDFETSWNGLTHA